MNEETNPAPANPHARMPVRSRIMFFVVAWIIVLMPFLFWRSTWFGRPLSDSSLDEYLHDGAHPRHIQHALVQLGERIRRHDPNVSRWYPYLPSLVHHPLEEIRNTDAWVMGQDSAYPEFHNALLSMLQDPSPTVRSNAALSLLTFGDQSGHSQVLEMLKPATVASAMAGTVTAIAKPGEPIRQGTVVGRTSNGSATQEVRSPITGYVHTVAVKIGQNVMAGDPMATIDPGAEQAWEALRALYLIGDMDDLPVVRLYTKGNKNLPDRISQQARATETAILKRASEPPPK